MPASFPFVLDWTPVVYNRQIQQLSCRRLCWTFCVHLVNTTNFPLTVLSEAPSDYLATSDMQERPSSVWICQVSLNPALQVLSYGVNIAIFHGVAHSVAVQL